MPSLKQIYEDSTSVLEFYVNNELKLVKNVDPRTTLLEYLRQVGYKGAKLVCGEGGCGACTVCIAEYDTNKQMVKYRSANACLIPLCSVHNKQVVTIEGIGSQEVPHALQVVIFGYKIKEEN